MFDDDEDQRTEFDDWFEVYYTWFPEELADGYEPAMEISDFYHGPYTRIKQELAPELRKLMNKQYPEMELEMRPAVVKKIDWIIARTGDDFLVRLFGLMFDETKGTDLRAKYPKFNDWVQYSHPRDPYKNSDEIFAKTPWLTDEQKKEIIEKTEAEDLFGINRKERRKMEFKDVLQTIVLKNYPSVENLSADGWIVYSAFLNWEAFEYKFHSDFVGTFIAFALPEEDIHLSYAELQKKFDEIYKEKFRQEEEARQKGLNKL